MPFNRFDFPLEPAGRYDLSIPLGVYDVPSSASYAARLAGQADSNASYGSRLTGQISSSQAWGARLTAQADSAQVWAARLTGQLTLAQAYGARLTGQATSSQAWATRVTGQLDSSQAWSVRTTGQATSSQAWGARASGQADSFQSYATRLTGGAFSEQAWGARLTAQATSAQAWSARMTGQSSSAQAYSARLTGQQFSPGSIYLVASGNEITDAVRTAGVSGDGRVTKNLVPNGGFETDATQWFASYGTGGSFTSSTDRAKFGTRSGKFVVGTSGDRYMTAVGDIGALRLGMVPGGTYTWSAWVYVPTGNGTTWSLRIFDYVSGVYASTASSAVAVFDQWVRLTVTRTIRAGATEAFARLENNSALAGQTVYIDGTQLEEGGVVTSYVDTNSVSLTAGVDSSFGIWEPTTNLIVKALGTDPIAAASLIGNAPTRVALGDGWYRITGTGPNSIIRFNCTLADLIDTQSYACSIFWKNRTGTCNLDWCDVTNASIVTSNPVDVGGGVTRSHIVQARATYTSTYRFFDIYLADGASIDIKWPQAENQPLATPYVGVAGGVRAAARVQAPVPLISGGTFWVAARLRMGFASTVDVHGGGFNGGTVLNFGLADANGYFRLFFREGDDSWKARVGNNVTSEEAYRTVPFALGEAVTVIAHFAPALIKLSVNGGAFFSAARTLSITPVATTFDIGSAISNALNSDILWLATGTGAALTDTDAALIHAFGDTDPEAWQLPGWPTMVWPAKTAIGDGGDVGRYEVRMTGRADTAQVYDTRLTGQATSSAAYGTRAQGQDDSGASYAVRIHGGLLGFHSPTEVRLTGMGLTATTGQGVRTRGSDDSSSTQPVRVTGQTSSAQAWSARLSGAFPSSYVQNVRLTGQAPGFMSIGVRVQSGLASSVSYNVRVTGETPSSAGRDVRLFGQGSTSQAQGVRLTASDKASVRTQDARLTGQAPSARSQDVRVSGQTDSLRINDIRLSGQAQGFISQAVRIDGVGGKPSQSWGTRLEGFFRASEASLGVRVGGGLGTVFAQDVRVLGHGAFSNKTVGVRLTGQAKHENRHLIEESSLAHSGDMTFVVSQPSSTKVRRPRENTRIRA